jgi:Protein of unknown function (DUF3263)
VEAPTASTAAYEWPPGSAVDRAIEQDASAIVDAALGLAQVSASTVDPPAGELSEVHYAMLDFERQWWRQPGAKEQAIRDTFSMSPTRYYQTLNALLDLPGAVSYDAALVHRLQRLRTSAVRGRRLG